VAAEPTARAAEKIPSLNPFIFDVLIEVYTGSTINGMNRSTAEACEREKERQKTKK
jgi:hypothetical protein